MVNSTEISNLKEKLLQLDRNNKVYQSYAVKGVAKTISELPDDNNFYESFWEIIRDHPYFFIVSSPNLHNILPKLDGKTAKHCVPSILCVTANDEYAQQLREDYTECLLEYISKEGMVSLLLKHDVSIELGWDNIKTILSVSELIQLNKKYKHSNKHNVRLFSGMVYNNTWLYERLFVYLKRDKKFKIKLSSFTIEI